MDVRAAQAPTNGGPTRRAPARPAGDRHPRRLRRDRQTSRSRAPGRHGGTPAPIPQRCYAAWRRCDDGAGEPATAGRVCHSTARPQTSASSENDVLTGTPRTTRHADEAQESVVREPGPRLACVSGGASFNGNAADFAFAWRAGRGRTRCGHAMIGSHREDAGTKRPAGHSDAPACVSISIHPARSIRGWRPNIPGHLGVYGLTGSFAPVGPWIRSSLW
jgi:hypothetical protein